jgi:Flp pilus assembly secretin CpaC
MKDSEATSPDPGAKLEHLREAARHLREAGFDAAAVDIDEQASKLLQRSQVELEAKREQLEELRREIAELERVTGIVQQFQINCRIVEVKASEIRALGVCNGSIPVDPACCKSGEAINILDTDVVEASLNKLDAKVLVDTAVVTNSGRPATVQAGGQFPVPTHGDRDDLAAENSSRDEARAVTLAGFSVPGIRLRRFHAALEMRLGQTLAQSCRTASTSSDGEKSANEDDPTVTLFLITPMRAEAIAPSDRR